MDQDDNILFTVAVAYPARRCSRPRFQLEIRATTVLTLRKVTTMWRTVAGLLILSFSAIANGQSTWIGVKVIPKYRTHLRIGAQDVDDGAGFRLYSVEGVTK